MLASARMARRAWLAGGVAITTTSAGRRPATRGTAGRRSPARPVAFPARLAGLRARGWGVVWTLRNPLPIDSQFPGPADHAAAEAVLGLADMVLCHTRADAAALRARSRAEIQVTGWAALEPPARPPTPEVASLATWMRAAPVSFLLAGHLTACKDAPGTVAAYLACTGHMAGYAAAR